MTKGDGTKLALGAAGLLAAATLFRGRGSAAKVKPYVLYDELRRHVKPFTDVIEVAVAQGTGANSVIRMLKAEKDKRASVIHFYYGYVQAGEQVFVVGPRLMEMFLATGLDRVPPEAIHLPFPSYYVSLIESPGRIWSKESGWLAVKGVFVREVAPGQVGLQIIAPQPTANDRTSFTTYNDAYAFIDFNEAASWPGGIEPMMDTKMVEAMEVRGYTGPEWTFNSIEIAETYKKIGRIIVNAMLYTAADASELWPDPDSLAAHRERKRLEASIQRLLRSNERERTKLREKERIEREIARQSGATVVWLGATIEAAAAAESPRDPARSMRRHWVRGHWRVPARKHGPPRLRWIQPFERAKDSSARVTGRTYQYDEDREE